MLLNYDARTVGDLCSDNGTRVSATALLTDPNLASALNTASGKLDAALQVGGLYKPSDLAALVAATNSSTAPDSTGFLLISVVCDMTMMYLMQRRPAYDINRMKALAESLDGKDGSLTRLRRGENVFGLPTANIDAGLPSIDGPTTLDYQNLNLMRDRIPSGAYFPPRVNPFNR